VCVQLGIFSRSYYVLIMGFLARSVVWGLDVCAASLQQYLIDTRATGCKTQ
jgi:hypothetical protein